MKNSPIPVGIRAYAPRIGVKRTRVGISLDPRQLDECERCARAEHKATAAYALEVYLEGLAARRRKAERLAGVRKKSPQAVYED